MRDLAHRIEPASSARANCRGCGERIATGALRFGESLPNPFADGEMTYLKTTDVLPRVRRFSPALREEDLAALQADLARPAP